jgi:hypothetical protein
LQAIKLNIGNRTFFNHRSGQIVVTIDCIGKSPAFPDGHLPGFSYSRANAIGALLRLRIIPDRLRHLP